MRRICAVPGRIALAAALLALSIWGAANVAAAETPTKVEVYATGLVNPKGMAFTADGTLYVAESGKPGDVNVPLPANFGGTGPIGTNGRISRIRPGAQREDFVTGLPNIGLYGGVEMLGPTGMAVLGGQLYEVAAGHMTVSPALSRVSPDGKLTRIADLGAFNNAHPPNDLNGDAVPMGNPFDLVALGGNLYITDGNYNRVIKATPDGTLSLLAESSTDSTSTGAAAGPDDNLYVSQFGSAPYTSGTGRIDVITPDGKATEGAFKNLTTPIDVAFAPDGTMYVLQYAAEFSAERLRYVPFGGEVLRMKPDGSTEPVVTNLVFPTAMTFGPDGALYVTNYGNESNNGQGQVLRVVLGDLPGRGPDVPSPDDTGTYAPSQATPVTTPAQPAVIGARVTLVEAGDASKWGFDPAEVTIQTGQSVVFTNSGRIAHTVTDSQGAFDTGLLKGGESATVRFDYPGRYAYYCQPHPWMKGVINVVGPPRGPATPVAGTVTSVQDRPPTIGAWRAFGFVAVLLALVFGGAFLMRRRPKEMKAPPPEAD